MSTSRTTLKSWFVQFAKPTQEQFHAWLDSFWHKDDEISMSSINGLSSALTANQTFMLDRIGQQDYESTAGQTDFVVTDFVVVSGKVSIYRDGSLNPKSQITEVNGQTVSISPAGKQYELITLKQG